MNREKQKEKEKPTRTEGSHARFVGSETVVSAIPAGGPRKFSHTSRSRDSSASLQFKNNLSTKCLFQKSF